MTNVTDPVAFANQTNSLISFINTLKALKYPGKMLYYSISDSESQYFNVTLSEYFSNTVIIHNNLKSRRCQ